MLQYRKGFKEREVLWGITSLHVQDETSMEMFRVAQRERRIAKQLRLS